MIINQNKNFIITNISNLDNNSSVIYLLNGEKKFLNEWLDNNFLTYDINDEQYNNSKRKYAINALCYRNNWRNFPSYVTSLFKDNKNTEAKLDELLITKQDNTFIYPSISVFWGVDEGFYALEVGNSFTADNIFNINLKNVKSYEIIKPSENIYNYYIIKITTDNNNTYIMSGFNDKFDFYNGYIYPTEKGTAVGQNNAGNNIFIFDTSEKSDKIKGERVLLDDILKDFIENEKVSQVYNDDIYIERKEKNINITVKNSQYKTKQNLSSESILVYPIFGPVFYENHPLSYHFDKGRLAYKKSFCWENKNGVKYFISDVSIPLYEDENTLKFYMKDCFVKVNF